MDSHSTALLVNTSTTGGATLLAFPTAAGLAAATDDGLRTTLTAGAEGME